MVCLAKKKKKNSNKKPVDDVKKLKIYKVEDSSKKEQDRVRREKGIQIFLVVLIIILAVAAIFSAIQTFFPDLFGRFSLSGELAAKVNGVPITMKQLTTEYDRLPLEYKYFITKEAFLNQLIDETLLTQEATRQGLKVSEEEIDESIQAFLNQSNISEERLDDILAEKQLTRSEFRTLIRNQLVIDKLLDQEIRTKLNITSEQALQYYNENPTTFKIPELVTARHILINTLNRTEEEAEERANMVFEFVKNDTKRFCSYVWLYTDDAGSAETCGEYTFPRGQMVEEFENKAFEQDVGDLSVVQTSFGFHILMTVNKTPEQFIPFRDVQEQITLILQNQQEKALYSDFIVGLREQATIITYYEEVVEEAEEPEVSFELPEEVTGEVVAEEEEVAEEEAAEEGAIEEMEEITEEQEALEEEVEEALEEVTEEPVEEPEEVVEEPVEEPVEEVPTDFAECLTSKGAVLYGAFWDSSTKKQRSYFGTDIDKINYVECGVEGDFRAQETVCSDAGILAYPTWIIDNQKHMGILSLDQLAALTGCEK